MAMIGYLGRNADDGVRFTISREVFLTPKDMTWGGSARYATHERHATHALTEFTGLDPDTFSFDILLTAELGVNPLDEIAKIWGYERDGEALGLVIGGKAYGKCRWTIRKHQVKMEYMDAEGKMYAVEVSVDMMEYLKWETNISKTAAEPVTSGTGGGDASSGGSSVRTYTVKKGDCMWNIAKTFYGSGAQYMKIYEANRGVIGSNPALIYPGQVLVIP